jgi:hypothetical protein
MSKYGWVGMINKQQRNVILIGLGIILLMGLIPPWKCSLSAPDLPHVERPGKYGFLFYPPSPDNVAKQLFYVIDSSFLSVQMDINRLFVQWIAVTIAVVIAVILLKGNRGKQNDAI